MADLPSGLSYGPGGVVTGSVTSVADPYYKQRQIDRLTQVAAMLGAQKRAKEEKLYAQVNAMLEDPNMDPDLVKSSEAMRKLRKSNKSAWEAYAGMLDAKKPEYDIKQQGMKARQQLDRNLRAQPMFDRVRMTPIGGPMAGMLPSFDQPVPREQQFSRAINSLRPEDFLALNMRLNTQGTDLGEQGFQPPITMDPAHLTAAGANVEYASRGMVDPLVGDIGMVQGGLDPTASQELIDARAAESRILQERQIAVAERNVAVREKGGKSAGKLPPSEGKKVEPVNVVPKNLMRRFATVMASVKEDPLRLEKVNKLKNVSKELMNAFIAEGLTRQEAMDAVDNELSQILMGARD